MLSVEELRTFAHANATPPHQLRAFQDGMLDMYAKHPEKWVVYTDLWDEAARTFDFVVHGAFDTQKEAVDSTKTLSPKERGRRTVISTHLLPAAYRL